MKRGNIHVITGIRAKLINSISDLFYLLFAAKEYRSFRKAFKVMSKLFALKREIAGHHINKIVKANGRYHWNMHLPGFPSKALTKHVLGEMNRISPVRSFSNRLSILFIGITKKCPLKCLHCYEWDALNQKDTLSLDDLKKITRSFQESGVSHIQLGGGEPMSRFEDMIELIKDIKPGTDIWISTCGFNLSEEKAVTLKNAGLTGVAISLDHFEPELHNAFRGHPKAFDWAISATENCRKAGLITCWSICVTREFISRENLFQYTLAAKKNNVTYVQFFEPMPAGRFSGKDVALDPEQLKILTNFYIELNTSPKYRDFPLLVYLGVYQRRIGCLGSGNRYVYVDTDGNIQSCPFCRTNQKMVVNDHPVNELLQWIMKEGCHHVNVH
jgi:MoaA/NifB/PqqE/SkfB family radical SAM enzyme